MDLQPPETEPLEAEPRPARPSGIQDSFSTLLLGTGTVFVGLAARIGLLFLTELIAARHLGPAQYGLLSWAITVLSVSSMLTCLGLPTAARRFIPIDRQSGDRAALRGTIRVVTLLTGAAGLLGLGALILGARPLSLNLLGDPAELPIFEVLVFILPFWNLQKAFLAFSAGFKRPKIKVLVEDLINPAGLLVVVSAAALTGHGAREIAAGYVVVHLISAIVAAVAIRFRTPYRETSRIKPRYRTREILGFSWPLIFTETLGKATGIIDIFIIGILALSADVGIYRVGSDLAVTMSLTLMCFGYLYLPIATEHFARKDFAGWESLNARVARWTMLAAFPIFAVLFFRSGEVLHLVYGPEYAGAEPVLTILAVNYFLHASLGFTGANLVVAGNTRWQLMAHLAALIIKIVGAAVLIPRYGVTGAALATLAGTVATNGINLAVAGSRYGLHPFTLPWARALACLVGGALLLHLGAVRVVAGGILGLGLFGLGVCGLLLALSKVGIIFDSEDRLLFNRILRERSNPHD